MENTSRPLLVLWDHLRHCTNTTHRRKEANLASHDYGYVWLATNHRLQWKVNLTVFISVLPGQWIVLASLLLYRNDNGIESARRYVVLQAYDDKPIKFRSFSFLSIYQTVNKWLEWLWPCNCDNDWNRKGAKFFCWLFLKYEKSCK